MTKLKNLQGRTAIVTGTSHGIGPFIAASLAREGVNLVLAARSARELDQVAADVRSHEVRVITVPTDVADPQALRALAAAAEREFGEIDILVNNAGFDWQIPFHFPGPGRLIKALWDFFPGMGPSMNRMAGVEGVMERIAVVREQQRNRGTAGSPAA
jgi:NAD(P)-dependent dehydrogenase (short-subunit alcohol dehydrogenase family)